MLSPIATDDLLGHVEKSRTKHANIVALKAEINRLRKLLAIAEERLNERTIDAMKAQNEAKRQQARVENGMCWAEERRMEFLQICAERDSLRAEVKRLQSKPLRRTIARHKGLPSTGIGK